MKILSVLVTLLIIPTVATAEIVRLEDGRSIILNNDNTFEFIESTRGISVSLRSVGKPVGYGANPNRDCGMTFTITNKLGGDILNLDINLAIFNSDGDKILAGGIMGYELDPFSFSDKIISPGATETETIDVEESCNRISQVIIGDVGEKWCNFVGRLPNDRCRNLIQVGSRVNSISFNK